MPHPHSHLQHGPAAPAASDPDWRDWSDAWTRHIPVLTGRTDLRVTVAPGAGGGAPACFYPDTRRIEVDATHIGVPDVANPRRAGHKKLVPTAYGLLVHEAAHAAHSQWTTPPDTPPVVAAVADLLEESRSENRQRGRRRGDRRWLRHTVTTLLDPADAAVDDAWHAAHLAGLLLARVDARIITAKDIKGVRAAVTAVLGRKRLLQLRDVWRQAHATGDTDAEQMIELAWRWCHILGIDPHRQPHTPVADPGVFAGLLAQALADYLAHTAGLTPAQYRDQHITARHSAPATWTRRDPTDAERAASRALAARLRRARTHSPEPDTRPSTIPPGRLRTRHAITAQAQIAAGTLPTATPWQRRRQLPPPKPTLHLGVIVDASFSMHPFMAPMSSAGWTLAHAARSNQAVTATIAFGSDVTLLVRPRQHPTHVLELGAAGGSTAFTDAVKLADEVLQLRQPGRLRMLAVVSDGDLPDIDPAQRLITTLHRAGCPVLWLRPADLAGHTFTHTTTLLVADPLEAAGAIADAAVAALETA
ncbi:VWA domain-containing protein [Micromonospora sp. 4G57]|uniref:VWA domain-containing protein n=1 Tax=Micromonospora sicca TaxID=2202420 RepID=A0ABU5JMV3_9ACTN|nr:MULTISPECIES: VWA domain-containing protein [unclassified Micromonospora]MDZ5447259.1 VWA domain-containing protein [Micromonospora sp. 4G57]MDZ5493955.1 VWA domain-containing protein [Micromonospora sp. 4G53]